MDEPHIAALVYDHFDAFVTRNLLQYFSGAEALPAAATPVGFVGSIAFFYRDTLERVLRARGLTAAAVMQSPMQGLKTYHRNDAQPTQF